MSVKTLFPFATLSVLALGLLAQAQESGGPAAVLAPAKAGLVPVPLPELNALERSVADQIRLFQKSFEQVAAKPGVANKELAEAYGTLGQLYHAYEFTDSAQGCYVNASLLEQQDYRWLHLLGRLHEQVGELESSVSYYEAARQARPDYAPTVTNLGRLYLQLNRVQDARKEFQTALRLDSDCAAAHNGMGEAALAQRRYSEAVRYFQAVLKRASQANRVHYSLAMAYRGMGDLEKARFHLKQRGSVGIRSDDPLVDGLQRLLRGERVHMLQGRFAFAAGRFEEAVQAFGKAVEAGPNSLRARVNLGTALGKIGDLGSAAEQFRTVLRVNSQHPIAHFNLGTIMVRQGNRTQAIKHFQFVLSINPKDLAANRELALSLSRVGRSEEALTYFSKVVALAPDDETSLISLSSLLVSENRDRQARDLLDQAHRRFPNRGRTTHALARLLAACPDAGVCDGDRALKLALQVYRSTQFVAHGETVAMALAQVGRCQEAAEWQRRMVAAAERANEPALATRLQQQVVRYERNRPCAPRSSRRQSPP